MSFYLWTRLTKVKIMSYGCQDGVRDRQRDIEHSNQPTTNEFRCEALPNGRWLYGGWYLPGQWIRWKVLSAACQEVIYGFNLDEFIIYYKNGQQRWVDGYDDLLFIGLSLGR